MWRLVMLHHEALTAAHRLPCGFSLGAARQRGSIALALAGRPPPHVVDGTGPTVVTHILGRGA